MGPYDRAVARLDADVGDVGQADQHHAPLTGVKRAEVAADRGDDPPDVMAACRAQEDRDPRLRGGHEHADERGVLGCLLFEPSLPGASRGRLARPGLRGPAVQGARELLDGLVRHGPLSVEGGRGPRAGTIGRELAIVHDSDDRHGHGWRASASTPASPTLTP